MASAYTFSGDVTVQAHPSFPNLYGTGTITAVSVNSSGASTVKYTAVTASTTLAAASHSNVSAATSGGAVVLSLPAAVAGNVGLQFSVQKGDSSANLLSIAPSGTDTIDGVNASIYVMGLGSSVRLLVSAAGAWVVVEKDLQNFITSVTATGTLAEYHDTVLVNSGGATTTTLLSTASVGKKYNIINIGAGAATVSAGAGTINGSATHAITAQYAKATYVHLGSNVWYVAA